MSSLFKLVNIGGKTVEVRLVKKANNVEHFAGNVKPDGSVDDETELSFKLGGVTGAPYEHIVLAHADTPNIINPTSYITNGSEYSLVKDDINSLVSLVAELSLSVDDPNYATRNIGIFFRVSAADADYVMSTPTGSFNVSNNLNASVADINTLRASKGVYFSDNDYYIPLYLGYPKDIIGVWAAQTYGVNPLYNKGISNVKQVVELVRFVPVQSIAITNTTLIANKNTTLDILTTLTPTDATIQSLTFSSDNPDLGAFEDPAIPTLSYKGIGDFNVSVLAVDMAGTQVSTSRAARGLIDTLPFTVRLSPTAESPTTSFDVNGSYSRSYVDWGDGIVTDLSTAGSKTYNHTYITPGSYLVKVYTDGVVNSIVFASQPSYQEHLTEVVSWGQGNINQFVLADSKLLTTVPATEPPYATRFDNMFRNAIAFNGDITGWNLSKATDLSNMFDGASAFNRNISTWNVSNVEFFGRMFAKASSFNQPIGSWNMASAVSLTGMFESATVFNQSLNAWNVSNVENMSNMFNYALMFNQDLNTWDTSKVTNMNAMFRCTPVFNSDITTWNTSAVTDMSSMFLSDNGIQTAFNRNISSWDVSNVTNMNLMFMGTTYFNQDLRWWCVDGITEEPNSFATGVFVTDNRPRWGMCPLKEAVASIVGADGSFIVGGSLQLSAALNPTMPIQSTVWASSNPAVITIDQATGEAFVSGMGTVDISVTLNGLYTTTKQITTIAALTPLTLKTTGITSAENYDVKIDLVGTYSINWGDGTVETRSSSVSHKYATAEPYVITVSPANNADIPAMTVMGEVAEVLNWYGGVTNQIAFGDLNTSVGSKITKVPTSAPNGLTNMERMFALCQDFNQNLATWNTSAVTNMSMVFAGASKFNQPIGTWDTTNVTTMQSMFDGAVKFNQDISAWEVGNVTNMASMFWGAAAFTHDLSMWCVPLLTQEPDSFGASAYLFVAENYPVWGTCPNRSLVTTIIADKTTIGLGLKTRLTYETNPVIEVTDEKWSVDDSNILSVSTRGLITAKALGTTIVHLTLNNTYKTSLRLDVTALSFDATTMVLEMDAAINDSIYISNSATTEAITVDFGDGEVQEILAGSGVTYSYVDAGKYYIQIVPGVEPLSLTLGGGYTRVLQWSSVGYSTLVLSDQQQVATKLVDVPMIEPIGLTSYKDMFYQANSFNDDLSQWNTASITDMSGMFKGASSFNGNITGWNTGLVTDMGSMFEGASAFNQDISAWNVGGVASMTSMFNGAAAFNAPIVNWDVSNVENMDTMFANTAAFDQDLRWWCVAKVLAEPSWFAINAQQLTASEYPVWGTCPNRNYTLTINGVSELMVDLSEAMQYTLSPLVPIVSTVWSVMNPEVATINVSGHLTGVSTGSADVRLLVNGVYEAGIIVPIVAKQVIVAPSDLTATLVVV